MFKINHLDHVAILVKDMEIAIEWYERVIGLKRYSFEEWGPFPIFMLAGTSGVAIFPEDLNGETPVKKSSIRIEHFAFNVDNENFKKAQEHYDALGINYTIKDHFHFHSIYTKDPDGHTVELTTLIGDASDFY